VLLAAAEARLALVTLLQTRRPTTATTVALAVVAEGDELLVRDHAVAVAVEAVDHTLEITAGEGQVHLLEALAELAAVDRAAAITVELVEELAEVGPAVAPLGEAAELVLEQPLDLARVLIGLPKTEALDERAVRDAAAAARGEAVHHRGDLVARHVDADPAEAVLELALVDLARVIAVEVLEALEEVHAVVLDGGLDLAAQPIHLIVDEALVDPLAVGRPDEVTLHEGLPLAVVVVDVVRAIAVGAANDARLPARAAVEARLDRVARHEDLSAAGRADALATGEIDEVLNGDAALAVGVEVVEEPVDRVAVELEAHGGEGLLQLAPIEVARTVAVQLLEHSAQVGPAVARLGEPIDLVAEGLGEEVAVAARVARHLLLTEAHKVAVRDLGAVTVLVEAVDQHACLLLVEHKPRLFHRALELARIDAAPVGTVEGLEDPLEAGQLLGRPTELAELALDRAAKLVVQPPALGLLGQLDEAAVGHDAVVVGVEVIHELAQLRPRELEAKVLDRALEVAAREPAAATVVVVVEDALVARPVLVAAHDALELGAEHVDQVLLHAAALAVELEGAKEVDVAHAGRPAAATASGGAERGAARGRLGGEVLHQLAGLPARQVEAEAAQALAELALVDVAAEVAVEVLEDLLDRHALVDQPLAKRGELVQDAAHLGVRGLAVVGAVGLAAARHKAHDAHGGDVAVFVRVEAEHEALGLVAGEAVV